MRAWKTRRPFAFNGRFTQLRYVNPWPVPIQTPRPPVWIPGGGSIETWEWCVKNDFLYAYLTYFGYESGISVIDGYWETVDRLGAEPNPYRAAFLQFVGVAVEIAIDADIDFAARGAEVAVVECANGLGVVGGDRVPGAFVEIAVEIHAREADGGLDEKPAHGNCVTDLRAEDGLPEIVGSTAGVVVEAAPQPAARRQRAKAIDVQQEVRAEAQRTR